jgi:hypothetical protein
MAGTDDVDLLCPHCGRTWTEAQVGGWSRSDVLRQHVERFCRGSPERDMRLPEGRA